MMAAAPSRASGGARSFVFLAEQSSAAMLYYTIANGRKRVEIACKKGWRKVNKKFCDLKGRNIGIAEKV